MIPLCGLAHKDMTNSSAFTRTGWGMIRALDDVGKTYSEIISKG